MKQSSLIWMAPWLTALLAFCAPCMLHAACSEVGIPTIVRLDAQLIGPPLQQILRTIVGEQPK